MMRITETVKQLIIINVIFFVGSLAIGGVANEMLALHFIENPDFGFWQPLTSMFMHASPQHIASNMIGLWIFGSPLEHYWGTKRFLILYFLSGIGAVALHMGIDYYNFYHYLQLAEINGVSTEVMYNALHTGRYDVIFQSIHPDDIPTMQQIILMLDGSFNGITLGASGAVYGVMVAFAFMFPNAELGFMFVPVRVPAKYFVGGIVGMDVYLALQGQSIFGAAGDNVAHFAHIGGAITGFILMMMWRNKKFNHTRWN